MYLEFIQGNDNTHPLLSETIAVYLNIENKGYIIPFNHTECINWDKNTILSILSNINNTSYYFKFLINEILKNSSIFFSVLMSLKS